MRAYRFRQTVPAAEKVHGAGFTIVAGENRGSGLFLWGERMINARYAADHFFPAELIGVMLWQDCRVLVVLGFWNSEWQMRLITQVLTDR